jgi:acyl-CoA thioesterase I
MKRRTLLPLLFSLFASVSASAAKSKIMIACVGDSITEGAGVIEPQNKYPAQLAKLLGDDYVVQNCGVSGSTMLDEGDKPFKKQVAFTNAVQMAADFYIIMLGTNDSKAQNWAKKDAFALSTKSLVEAFQKANPKAKIFLCYPVPVMGTGNFGITNPIVHGEIIPLLKRIAVALKLPTIDLYAALDGHAELFPDTVHPNDKGAKIIAETVLKAIR